VELHKKDCEVENVKVIVLPHLEHARFLITSLFFFVYIYVILGFVKDRYQMFVRFLETERLKTILKESMHNLHFPKGEQFSFKRYLQAYSTTTN